MNQGRPGVIQCCYTISNKDHQTQRKTGLNLPQISQRCITSDPRGRAGGGSKPRPPSSDFLSQGPARETRRQALAPLMTLPRLAADRPFRIGCPRRGRLQPSPRGACLSQAPPTRARTRCWESISGRRGRGLVAAVSTPSAGKLQSSWPLWGPPLSPWSLPTSAQCLGCYTLRQTFYTLRQVFYTLMQEFYTLMQVFYTLMQVFYTLMYFTH